MSAVEVKLCSQILGEYYGEIVDKIGSYLLKNNNVPLGIIVRETNLKSDQVKKGLCTLIQHNLVEFEWNAKGFVEYSIDSSQILFRLQFPKCIYYAKTLYDDAGELLVEELLEHGQMRMSDVIHKVTTKLNEATDGMNEIATTFVRDKFVNLVKTLFFRRCPMVEDPDSVGDIAVPNLTIQDSDLFRVPEMTGEALRSRKRRISSDSDEDNAEPETKRQKLDVNLEDKAGDKGIYWRINFDRFNRYARDQLIVGGIANKVDMKAAEIVRTMLRISEVKSNTEAVVTIPMSNSEIFKAMPAEYGVSQLAFDQYLKILSGDPASFILKTDESGGGMYAVDLKKALAALCQSHLESVVQERFGSKCCRIFRLLLMKKHLEQKQIEESAMIPAKEAKEMLYQMFGEHFITITEIPRTPEHVPSRTFYLFSVNINQVARMVLHRSYKAMTNLITRRKHELKQHKRLLDKQQRVEAIIASLEASGADEAQKEEIRETITPPEKAQLTKVRHITDKLEQSELQLEETIFVLDLYLKYCLQT